MLLLQAFTVLIYEDVEIQINALRWIDGFFDVSPENIQHLVPQLLGQVLPALSNEAEEVRQAANKVNTSLIEYIISLSEEQVKVDGREEISPKSLSMFITDQQNLEKRYGQKTVKRQSPLSEASFSYDDAIDALTLQFLNKNEATRVASLAWLTMLQSKAPRKVDPCRDILHLII